MADDARLSITDDSLSYDMYSQVAMALRGVGRAQILGALEPKTVLSIGQSQSAGRLTLYYNSVHPLHKVYDGYLIQVGGGPFRTDIAAPMIQVMSETEVRGAFAGRPGRSTPWCSVTSVSTSRSNRRGAGASWCT